MGVVVAVTVTVTAMVMEMVGGGSWCVAKIGVSEEVLQRALDSACGDGGADCAPIQPNRLCFSPNTLQAHASYAFNSFYQRNGRASNACLFDGASTIAQTDPSYGSCMYPSSAIKTPTASTAEVTNTTVPTPSSTTTTPIQGGDVAGVNPQIPQNSTPTSNTISSSFLLFLLILFLGDTFFVV
ncbi:PLASMODESMATA CALLOSE-BINDING PROTEIN 3-like [Vigna umbellata]|uniref:PLASMODESMATA CALLOSE-BINDING PROTEIN 3-like n=1 Tax=Vigna umbellata TaxID=87088 RepID=UPI001F5E6D62|nr:PLASMODESMATA CALLOSE-BINDING PROTEIN 3-like [Vigna umbellata]